MPVIEEFAGIKRVALEIAYDNGLINRNCTERNWLDSLDPVLGADGVDHADLAVLDVWCMTLTDEEVIDLACGEQDDMKAVAEQCPNPELVGLFEDIFNNEL